MNHISAQRTKADVESTHQYTFSILVRQKIHLWKCFSPKIKTNVNKNKTQFRQSFSCIHNKYNKRRITATQQKWQPIKNQDAKKLCMFDFVLQKNLL